MPDSSTAVPAPPRVRFAPSPTGFLHVGSARTFIFNWLYARHNHGTMVLRLDDTDVERNNEASVQSIFEGLRWLGLDWDEEYKQSERLDLHRAAAQQLLKKNLAYRDFTPAHAGPAFPEIDNQSSSAPSSSQSAWLFNPGMREMPREESDRRAAAGEPFALRYRVPRGPDSGVARILHFVDAVYGAQSRPADEVEDFALLRSVGAPKDRSSSLGLWDGMPTYHLASCVDDADLRISHIIRGQDHLTNTYKHLLIFEALGAPAPQFAHLPLLVAPDGAKLSKRKHGPVVSVTTYRDAGFLPQAFVNFLCLLGWSPKNDREFMALDEIRGLFTLEGVNRANAVVNFTEEDPFDAKAVWLNAEHIRALPVEELARQLQPFFVQAGFNPKRRETRRRHAPHPRAHQALARRRLRRRFLLRLGAGPVRSGGADPPQKGRIDGRRRYGSARSRNRAAGARHNEFRPRFARQSAARSCRHVRPQGRADVSTHSRRSLRTQKCPAPF